MTTTKHKRLAAIHLQLKRTSEAISELLVTIDDGDLDTYDDLNHADGLIREAMDAVQNRFPVAKARGERTDQ